MSVSSHGQTPSQLPGKGWVDTINPLGARSSPVLDEIQEQLKTPYQRATEEWQGTQSEVRAAQAYLAFTKNPTDTVTRERLVEAIKARTGRTAFIGHQGSDAMAEFDRRGDFFMYGPDVATRFMARKETEELAARNKVIKMALTNAAKGVDPNPQASWKGVPNGPLTGQMTWPDPNKK